MRVRFSADTAVRETREKKKKKTSDLRWLTSLKILSLSLKDAKFRDGKKKHQYFQKLKKTNLF